MKTIRLVTAFFLLALASFSTHADPILVVTPSDANTTVGSQVSVDVSITGLLDQFVGDYDLSLAFDEAVLSFTDIVFGTFLDGPDDSLQLFFDGPGSVGAFEISFFALFNQDGFSDFSLFTLNFDVIGAGTSALDLSVFAIGDFFGDPLSVGIQNSSVTAVGATSVPEPGTFVLLSIGLLGLVLSRQRSIQKQR